ncbi:sigma-70 family RNA polymerase sigma factor [Marinomonas agarivorans]|nr:sigma-70 family RNA polymerase sigma factor [Marinomonas agarivorans]
MSNFSCDLSILQDEVDNFVICTEGSEQQRCKEAISDLYCIYRKDLLLHLQMLVRDINIAEELLHDTFMRVFTMSSIRAIKKPRPFLMKVAHNLALDYLRQKKSKPTENIGEREVELDFIVEEPEYVDQLIKAHRLRYLRQAITNLPPRAKEALLLSKYREMTLKQVAQEMRISQTMVEKHLKTALEKCREAMCSKPH